MNYDELAVEDQAKLNKFLSRCEFHLSHLNDIEKTNALNLIKEKLLLMREENEFHQIFLQYSDTINFVNSFLVQLSLPLAKKKKKNFFLYFFLILLILIGLTVYGIFSAVKSFVENVEVTSDKFSMMNGAVTISSQNGANINIEGQKNNSIPSPSSVKMTGDAEDLFEKIVINSMSTNSVYTINSAGNKFKYECEKNESNMVPLTTNKNVLTFSTQDVNVCKITVPEGRKLTILAKDSVIYIKNMKQDFSVDITNGTFLWSEINPQNFSVERDISGVSANFAKFSEKGKFKAKITGKNSVITIK